MKLRNWIGLALIILVQSCIPSLHPLYTEDTIVFETSLLGTWTDDEDTYVFERWKENAYLFTYMKGPEQEQYEVHMVKLGPDYYLDFYSHRKEGLFPGDDAALAPLIRTHSFAKVKWDQERLEISHFAELEWLENLFDQRKIRIKHERVDDEIVLTAGPIELQKFFLKYANDPNIFTETVPLKRVL